MTRILFVDDEVRILDGLRRMLWKHRGEWAMDFATGPESALAAMQRDPFDVLVTDMRMAEMDGAALLKIVKQQWPATARIVLSGQTEAGAAERAAIVAHQFLSKPCDPNELSDTITRIEGYRRLVPDRSLQSALGRIACIPSAPQAYEQLARALGDGSPAPALSRLIREDPGLTASVLKLVSSSFFGRARPRTDVDVALGSVGLNRLRSVMVELREANAAAVSVVDSDLVFVSEARHARTTASVARAIAPDTIDADCAWVAGLLHDVGKSIACVCLPDGLGDAVVTAQTTHVALTDIEAERGGPTHAQLGGYLLGLWGVRPDVVSAVVHHHAPFQADPAHVTIAATIHVADVLSHYVMASADGVAPLPPLDDDAVRHLGGDEVLEKARRAALQAAALH